MTVAATQKCRPYIVFGAYDGPIEAKPGEKVVFVGDCAQWSGQLNRGPIDVTSLYRDRSLKDPYNAKHDDVYAKTLSVIKKLRETKSDEYVRFKGCPVSVAEQVLFLVELGGLQSPFTHPENAIGMTKHYLMWKSASAVKRLRGQSYQRRGLTVRGRAAPQLA